MLYKKHNYLNKNIPYLISNEIVEYDIQSAGFNILKKFGLVSEDKIKYLETLGKQHRQVQIGLYIKADKELGKKINEKFVEVRQWFFENNNLTDEDVLSIKKDAVITLKRCLITEMDNITFVEKNLYTSYYYINRYEFYYNKNTIDVKGIGDEVLDLHHEYMLDFLSNFFNLNEISSKKRVSEFIVEFIHHYKNRQLNIGYYRELNNQSLFRLIETHADNQIGVRESGNVNDIEIGYNYIRYIVPLISILL